MREGGGMPNSPFNLQMSVPMDFELQTVNGATRLWIEPSPELASLRGETKEWNDLTVGASAADPFADFAGSHFEVDAVIDASSPAADSGFMIFGEYPAVWKKADQTFSGMEGPQAPVDGKLHVKIFVDTCSMEVFVNGCYFGRYLNQKPGVRPLAAVANGGDVRFDSIKIHRLGSVWK
jgi:sucrose-6-phosphate hydrolase SacC (GH32 family)